MPDIPLSNKYLHDVKALYRDFAEHRIAEEELNQRLDELRTREAATHEHLGRFLLLEKLGEMEKNTAHEVQEEIMRRKREQEAEIQKKQREQDLLHRKQEQERRYEEQREAKRKLKRLQERDDYRREVNVYLYRLEENARSWQGWYTFLQIVLLIFSALTAAMASIDIIPRWGVSITGVIAAIAGGAITTFKIQDRIYANRKAIAEIQLECQKYDYHIEEYNDLNDEQRFIKFSRNINLIRGEQMLQEVEFWRTQEEEKKEEKAALSSPQKEEEKESDEIAKKAPQEEESADGE